MVSVEGVRELVQDMIRQEGMRSDGHANVQIEQLKVNMRNAVHNLTS